MYLKEIKNMRQRTGMKYQEKSINNHSMRFYVVYDNDGNIEGAICLDHITDTIPAYFNLIHMAWSVENEEIIDGFPETEELITGNSWTKAQVAALEIIEKTYI